MFSVPSISTLSNSIEAAMAERPSVRIRSANLRRSDKAGLANTLRNEYGIRGATVSIGFRSVTVYFANTSDTHKVVSAIREVVNEFARKHDYVVSENSRTFSVKKFLRALKR